MMQHKGKLALLFLAGLVAAYIVLPHTGQAQTGLGERPTHIQATAIPLNTDDPADRTVGKLQYVAGWALKADDPRFGGWSGLVVRPGGKKLVAISDIGVWLTADLDMSAKQPLSDAKIIPFEPAQEHASKSAYDSESVIEMPNDTSAEGHYIVSFEQKHRLHYAVPGGPNSRAPYSDVIDFTGVEKNSGMEAITWMRGGAEDGKLLVFIEDPIDDSGNIPMWLAGKTHADRLWLVPPKDFAATDAATLSNGDVLLLMRYYSPLKGSAAKILRIKAADIKPGAVVHGELLATLRPPLSVDNMEGLTVIERPNEPPLLLIISDDNFRLTQRTLLMAFTLGAG
nr:esterase-like activity of phytase family protein [Kordiimonas marina]